MRPIGLGRGSAAPPDGDRVAPSACRFVADSGRLEGDTLAAEHAVSMKNAPIDEGRDREGMAATYLLGAAGKDVSTFSTAVRTRAESTVPGVISVRAAPCQTSMCVLPSNASMTKAPSTRSRSS